MTDPVTSKDFAAFREACEQRDIAADKRMTRFEASLDTIFKALDTVTKRLDRLASPVTVAAANSPESSSIVSHSPPHTSYQPFHTRSVKLDFPRFDGTEPLHWLFRAEQFFAYYDTPDDQRLMIASVHMDGIVVAWFQMLQKAQQIPTWAAFARAVENQFGPSHFDSPRARLFKLQQHASAAAYYTEFMILSTRVEGMTDEAVLDCFISGLKPFLRRKILAHAPTSLLRAVDLARLFDDIGPSLPMGTRSINRPLTYSTPTYTPTLKALPAPPSTKLVASSSASPSAAPVSSSSSAASVPAYKRFTAAELRARREKGLCYYYCDDKYTPSHKCKPTFCLMMDPSELHEVLHGTSLDDGDIETDNQEGASDLLALTLEINLHALEGNFHP